MSEPEASTPEPLKITKEKEANQILTRNRYLERRNHIEQSLREVPKVKIVDLEDGARIKVISSISQIPEHLKGKEKSEKHRIAIYAPTIWYTNDPQESSIREIRLASSILSGNVDFVVRLKAEGMNDLAYKNSDGECTGESKVAASGVDILAKDLESLGINPGEAEFYIVGYSEGSTQGASIAAKIIEKGVGTVKEYVSIGGGGLIGAENQNDAKPIQFAMDAAKSLFTKTEGPQGEKSLAPGTGKTVLIKEAPDVYYVPAEVFGQEIKNTKEGSRGGGLEYAIGKTPEPPLLEALEPERKFAERLIKTKFGVGEDNPVPLERLKAATTKNHDYEKLARYGVPIIIITGAKDTFFDNKKVKPAALELKRRFPNDKIGIITSDSGHDDPWHNPSGFAFVLEIIRNKLGIS